MSLVDTLNGCTGRPATPNKSAPASTFWDFSWAVTTMNLGDVDLIDANGESLERFQHLAALDDFRNWLIREAA